MGKVQDRHPDRVYLGTRDGGEAAVWIAWAGGGRWMKAKFRKGQSNHGNGLEWGYGGSGPAQLALELLADATQDVERAVRYHQRYKEAVVGRLPRERWVLTRAAVLMMLENFELEEQDDASWGPNDRATLPRWEDN